MYFMDTCFYVQVFLIVHTHASNAYVSCTLAFWYKCFSSSAHMLLMHVFHAQLLFGTSVFLQFVVWTMISFT